MRHLHPYEMTFISGGSDASTAGVFNIMGFALAGTFFGAAASAPAIACFSLGPVGMVLGGIGGGAAMGALGLGSVGAAAGGFVGAFTGVGVASFSGAGAPIMVAAGAMGGAIGANFVWAGLSSYITTSYS